MELKIKHKVLTKEIKTKTETFILISRNPETDIWVYERTYG